MRRPHPGPDRSQRGRILTSATLELVEARFPRSWEAVFPSNRAARLPIEVAPFDQTVMGLKVAVPRDAEPSQVIRLHFVQRSVAAKRIVGGVAVQINVVKPGAVRPEPREKKTA